MHKSWKTLILIGLLSIGYIGETEIDQRMEAHALAQPHQQPES